VGGRDEPEHGDVVPNALWNAVGPQSPTMWMDPAQGPNSRRGQSGEGERATLRTTLRAYRQRLSIELLVRA